MKNPTNWRILATCICWFTLTDRAAGYRHQGKEKTLAPGLYPDISLAEARSLRSEARKLIAQGIDPCEQKRAKKSESEASDTFETIARRWHASNKKWGETHRAKVLTSLETHVFPSIGSRDIKTLKTPVLLVPVKEAEAKEIYETASRLQQRISAVMRYAAQSGIIGYKILNIRLSTLTY